MRNFKTSLLALSFASTILCISVILDGIAKHSFIFDMMDLGQLLAFGISLLPLFIIFYAAIPIIIFILFNRRANRLNIYFYLAVPISWLLFLCIYRYQFEWNEYKFKLLYGLPQMLALGLTFWIRDKKFYDISD